MSIRSIRPLGELIEPDIENVEVSSGTEYKIAGVYSFGRGLFQRGPISGAETSYKTLHRLRTSQLVVSRLKAFEGALAIVPSAFDGWFLSPEFPTFRCVDGQLDAGYLAHICRWSEFWSMLAATSKGIGARRERVHTEHLLRLELRVPSIDEQRRVARELDRIQACVIDVVQRSIQVANLTAALRVSISARPELNDVVKKDLGWKRTTLGSVMRPASDVVTVEADGSYPNVGIYSFGRGLFEKPNIEGDRTSAKMLNRIHAGQFIYSRLFAFEGAYGFVSPTFDMCFVSNEFPTFDPDPEVLDVRWLASYLRWPERWAELAGSSKGLGVRRQRVPVEAVLAHEVWLPPIEQQRAMVRAAESLYVVRQARAQSDQLAKALLAAALNRAFAELAQ
jgi:type I restriction enzyme S subunit